MSLKEANAEDKKLNQNYQKLLKVMSAGELNEDKKLLIVAQRAWVAFRDAECELDQNLNGGANSVNYAECKLRMTEERNQDFKRYLSSYY